MLIFKGAIFCIIVSKFDDSEEKKFVKYTEFGINKLFRHAIYLHWL